MENKEEILKAINIATEYYTKFAEAEYKVLVENNMQNGVCDFLKRQGFEYPIYGKISNLGKDFLMENFKEFKKEYNFCLKGYHKRSLYWSKFIPALSTDKVTMNQSLAIRLRILKAIKIQLESLYFS